MSSKKRAAKTAAIIAASTTTALTVIDPVDGSIIEPVIVDDSMDAWLADNIVRIAPLDKPKNPIGSNETNVLRGVKPSKFALVGVSDRRAWRNEAKRLRPDIPAEQAVNIWLVETGNDSRTRLLAAGYVENVDFWMHSALEAVVADAIVARVFGIRSAPLLAPRVTATV